MALPKGINPWHLDLEFHNVGRGAMDIKILYMFTKWRYWPVLWPKPLIQDDTFHTLRRWPRGYRKHVFSWFFFLRSYIYGSKEDFLRCNTFLLYYHNDPTLWPEPPTKGKEHYRENFGFGFFENIYGSWLFLRFNIFSYMSMFARFFVFLCNLWNVLFHTN